MHTVKVVVIVNSEGGKQEMYPGANDDVVRLAPNLHRALVVVQPLDHCLTSHI